MKLDNLRNFEWLNDPYDVAFDDYGMKVVSFANTEFWQNKEKRIHKDSGHFFFVRKNGNFDFTVKWRVEDKVKFAQCGLMMRIDENNWFKICGFGTSVTNAGYSDWANFEMSESVDEIWYKAKRNGADYILFYSINGKIWKQARLLHMLNDLAVIKIGAYICNPGGELFKATLMEI